MKLGFYKTVFAGASMLLIGTVAQSQVGRDDSTTPNIGLNLPSSLTPIGPSAPRVRKATAIVNGDVITGTDVDQRLALVVLANGGKVAADERERLRAQVLNNLIDETLQIQEAKANDVEVTKAEVEQSYARVSQGFKRSPQQMDEFLRTNGSSARSIKRQIEGEMAWSRLLRRRVEPFVNIGDDEVKAVSDRLSASKGTTEFRVGEIYLSATPENQQDVLANANKILAQLRNGGSFAAYARQFSESSSAGVGGDLGWIRPAQLPDELSQVLPTMAVGQIAGPIPVSGGFSILYLIDTKKILVADPRDAVLSLRQLSIEFPAGLTKEQAQARANSFVTATQAMQGCGGAETVAKQFGGDIVDNAQIPVRDLPPALQEMLGLVQVGQSTPPFGSQAEGVRVLILCGRDLPQVAEGPSSDQIEGQLREERINRRAQVYLRDLRRDAVIEYR